MNPVLRHLRMNIMETIKRQKILAESRGALWNQRQAIKWGERDRQTDSQTAGRRDRLREADRETE